jgi:transcriptional regulator with XRE-family HTH domain
MTTATSQTYDDRINRVIRGLCDFHGWTLEQLAEQAGMSPVVLSQKMRRQQRKRLTGEDVERLADVLGVDAFSIATGDLPPIRVPDSGPISVTRRYRMERTG